MKKGRKLEKLNGLYNTPTYVSWAAMRYRCETKTSPDYRNYGGRGISYTPEWKYFLNFYEDMGERPLGHTLDRLDVDADYSKENCRWSDHRTQSNNKRRTVYIDDGIRCQPLTYWSRETGIPQPTLYRRYMVQKLPVSLVLRVGKLSPKEVRDNLNGRL